MRGRLSRLISNYYDPGTPVPAAVAGTTFVVLKLNHIIAWSWWWVLAPFWMPIAIVLLIALIAIPVFVYRDIRAHQSPHTPFAHYRRVRYRSLNNLNRKFV